MPETPLTRRDVAALALLGALLAGYGVYVELRSAHMASRHTDLGVYLRAAWAVRADADPYAVSDDNGWHYTYPPLFAILMTPFADAPGGVPQPAWAVPYPVTVGLWYAFGVGCLFWSVHRLARALEEGSACGAGVTPRARQFWWVRCWPIWLCLPAVASTLSRGQVNLLLLVLLSEFIVAALRGRRAAAGWWLAAATCLKVIPALLVLYPLVRRDRRMLGHFVLGLAGGLVIVPLAVLGPERAAETARAFAEGTLLPGLTSEGGRLSRELTNMTATDNQSIQAIIHNALHPDRATRPATASPATKAAHVALGTALIVWTFVAAGRIADERYRTLFLLGGLLIVTVAVTPVTHTHYMVLGLPVVVGLVSFELERRGSFRWGRPLIAVAILHAASGILPRLPFLPCYELLRDLGVPLLGTLVLWYAALALTRSAETASAEGGAGAPCVERETRRG